MVNDKWERRSISDIGSHRAKYRSNIGGCQDAKYWHILAYIGVTAILKAFFLKGTCLTIHDFEPRLASACDTGIPVSQAAAINSLRMANALLAPG
jgi:hypothetical protein